MVVARPAAATASPATPLFVMDMASPARPPTTQGELVDGFRGGQRGRPDLFGDLPLHDRVERQLGQHLPGGGYQSHDQRRPQPEEHGAGRGDHGRDEQHREDDEVRRPGPEQRPDPGADEPAGPGRRDHLGQRDLIRGAVEAASSGSRAIQREAGLLIGPPIGYSFS